MSFVRRSRVIGPWWSRSFWAGLVAVLLAGVCNAQVYSASPNLAIAPSPTTTSTINVSGGPSWISSVRVVVKLRHGSPADLDLVLVRGTSYVRLSSACGGGGSDYYTTRFRDDTADSIYDGAAPFAGDFQPEGGFLNAAADASVALPGTPLPSLGWFFGQDPSGPWTLWIDNVGYASGTLEYWSLEFNGAEDPNGPYGGGPVPPPPPTFTEGSDAGDVLNTAAVCAGQGPLARIAGRLDEGDVDMYAIQVCDVASFSACTAGCDMDTQLWLFDPLGRGVIANDEKDDSMSQSRISGSHLYAPGLYYLAITAYDRSPVDAQGRPIWVQASSDCVERLPDGPGHGWAVSSWRGSSPGGLYRILLTGTCFVGPQCLTADFNCDGDVGTDADIETFFRCLSGDCPATPCGNTPDFNGDGDSGTDADIEALFRVLAGGNC